jgi:hypothetical protein
MPLCWLALLFCAAVPPLPLPPAANALAQPLDSKLFHNGRPGIVAWTLVNVAFATKM